MADERFRNVPAGAPGERWLTTVAALAVGTAFFALWVWLLPQWLGFRMETANAARWRWLAAIPSVVYGLWGIFVLAPVLREHVQPILQAAFGWLPLFHRQNSRDSCRRGRLFVLSGSIRIPQ